MLGYVRVNMSTGNTCRLPLPPDMRLLGGRGLIARLLYSDMDPQADALGPQNVFILGNGLLAACTALDAGRLACGGKSPLSGTLRESGADGTGGRALAELGLRAVVVEGRSERPEPQILLLGRDKSRLIDASAYEGMGIHALNDALRREYGPDVAVIGAGPAAALGYRCATVEVCDRHGRQSAAGGGLGAVMAAKGLRAVVLAGGRAALDGRWREIGQRCDEMTGRDCPGPSPLVELMAGLGVEGRDTVAALEQRCADAGLDAGEVCAVAGVAMQAGLVPFGDASAVLDLAAQMAAGTPLGRRMGQGSARFAHGLRASALPGVFKEQSEATRRNRAALDCLGLPLPVRSDVSCAALFSLLTGPLAAVYGGAWTAADVAALGAETLNLEQAFNDWAGMPSVPTGGADHTFS